MLMYIGVDTMLQMQTRKLSAQKGGQVMSYVPSDHVKTFDLLEQAEAGVTASFDFGCPEDGVLPVTIRIGPGVDADDPLARAVRAYSSTGQVRLVFPEFHAHAWNLPDHQLAWPAPEDVDTDDDGTATFECEVLDWEPVIEAKPFTTTGHAHRSSVYLTGHGQSRHIECGVPGALATAIDAVGGETHFRLTLDCVDGDVIGVVSKGEDTNPQNVRRLHQASNEQLYISSKPFAEALGLSDDLEDGPVRLRWWRQAGDSLLVVPYQGEGNDA